MEPDAIVGQGDHEHRGRQMAAAHHSLQRFEKLGNQAFFSVCSRLRKPNC
jgi:hypothetical protein